MMPPRLRERVKAALGALGHEPGWVDRLRARNLARTRKKLDVLVDDILERMDVAQFASFRGKACLEYGSGHLLSEALLYHLAGAASVVATDHFRLLQAPEVPLALEGVDAETLVAKLTRWDDPASIRRRLEALRQRTDWSPAGLQEIGISYVAPFDMTAAPLAEASFDMISSLSVLEHVPVAAAPALLAHLTAMLRPGGIMVHNIHLEDHRDIDGAPFAFLAADSDWTEADHDSRGNRLRASDWLRLVEAAPGTRVVRVQPLIKPGTELPGTLAARFGGYDPVDLRTSRIILVVARTQRP
jgi:SAM-dependent methyltransferase